MSSRLPTGLIVAGVAVLSLTPLAPPWLRHGEVVALHAYRPLASGLDALRAARTEGDAVPAGAEAARLLVEHARSRLAQRDAALLRGAAEVEGSRFPLLARVVEVESRWRKLAIDAGPDALLSPGDPVVAGGFAIGVVERAEAGFAVVRTPWTPRARFAAECVGAEPGAPPARFVTMGDVRGEWLAAVLTPETRLAPFSSRTVESTAATNLVPEDLLPLPPKLRLGTLEPDLLAARTGRESFCVRPAFDLRLLDAVVVLAAEPAGRAARDGFETRRIERLQPALLSARRDGEAGFEPGLAPLVGQGTGAPGGAAVARGGTLLGFVDAAFLGAVRARGIADPGREHLFVVVGRDSSRTLSARALRRFADGGRFQVLGGEPPAAGDLVLSAGRGVHCPRGLLVGQVSRADGALFDVARPPQGAYGPLETHVRAGAPTLPWNE